MSDVKYTVSVDTQQAVNNIRSLQARLRDTVNTTGRAMAGLATAAAGAAAAIYAFARAGMASADEQIKFARSVGATQGALRGLELAASDAGVSSSSLRSALEKLNLEIGRARSGTGASARAFAQLGISVDQIARMDADQRLALISDRIKELGLSSDQTAVLLRDLGIRQREMVLLMSEGGDAIRSASKEVKEYGLALNAVDSARIEAANDAMSRLKLVVESIQMKLAAEFAPILEVVATRFNTAAREAGGFGTAAGSAFRSSSMAIGYFLDVLNGLFVIFKGLKVVAHGFSATMITVTETAARAVAYLLDGVTYAVNSTIRGLNAIPGVDIEFITPAAQSRAMQNIRALAQGSRDEVAKATRELHDAAMRTVPTRAIEEFFDEVDAAHAAMMQRIQERTDEEPIRLPAVEIGGSSGISPQEQRAIDEARRAQEQWQTRIRQTALAYLPLKRAQEDFVRKTQELNAALKEGLISTSEHALAVSNLKREFDEFLSSQRPKAVTWAEGWKSAFEDYKVAANNAAAQGRRAFETATRGMEDAIVNFAKTGKFEWRSFLASILEDLLRSQIQQLIANTFGGLFGGGGVQQQPGPGPANNTLSGLTGMIGGLSDAVKGIGTDISGVLGGVVGGLSNAVKGIGNSMTGIIGGVTSAVRGIFGGFFANGGNLANGRIGVVGERGAELIRGPAQIDPLTSGIGGSSVTYNINAVDAMSFKQMIAQDPGFLYAVTEQGRRSFPASRR